MIGRFQGLIDERKRLCDLDDLNNDRSIGEKMYSIDHFFECETSKTYDFILDFAKKNNLKKVFDIGCAYGYQSEVFSNDIVEYVGINEDKMDYWNKEKYQYITNTYPFKIEANDRDLATSVLCLTWNCYLYEKEKTLEEQCLALSRDFKHVLLYMQKDKLEFVKKFFKGFEVLDKNFVYFYN